MNQTAIRVGIFPTDPFEIERVAELIVAEAAGETFGKPSELMRAWLAAELQRCPAFVELPETYSDAAYFPTGYWRDCAELFARLGALVASGPHRWVGALDRHQELGRLANAIRSIALYRVQYVADEHVELAVPRLQAIERATRTARAGRASKAAPRARKAKRAKDDARAARFDAEIRRRVKAGEKWRGMPGRVAEALGEKLSTAGDQVRRIRKTIEKEKDRH